MELPHRQKRSGEAFEGRNEDRAGDDEMNPDKTKVRDADEAAGLAAVLAEGAASRGTFGVGGLLIDNATGEVLDRASNAVVETLDSGLPMTHDPTAHSEMQLIGRYSETIAKGGPMPEPGDLTIVTSLEPCAMCAGAIMETGFNVGIVALDPDAGIGAHGNTWFDNLPAPIRGRASDLFAYYEIADQRAFTGSENVAFTDCERKRTVASANHLACLDPFRDNLEAVMKVVNETGRDSPVRAPAALPEMDPLVKLMRNRLPHALSTKPSDGDDLPSGVIGLLEDLHERTADSSGSAALIDRHGNLLVASAGRTQNPALTGLVDVIGTYSRFRFEAFSTSDVGEEALGFLPHPKNLRLLRYPVPDPESPLTLMEFGAYGSTMEGPLPMNNRRNLIFIKKGGDGDRVGLRNLIEAMPPVYTETFDLEFQILSN